MQVSYFVRVGIFGHVGRFRSSDDFSQSHGRRVVCRTRRGLEVGELLGPSVGASSDEGFDGQLLRAVRVEDDLLLARLERNRDEAYAACVEQIEGRQLDAVLMDVELLFDGESLYFYFLGEVSPEIEKLTSVLAETYEAKVQFREFADAVDRGCGPDCGTEAASGCGTTGCSSCSIAAACKK